MRVRVLAATALVLTLVLAGCNDKPNPAATALEDATQGLDLEATSTTGVIRGVVVNSAITPIAGVTVQLQGETPLETTTNDDGAFGFEGLAPGTYFLMALKPGYGSVQQSVEVAAGVAEPAITKILIDAIPGLQPRYDIFPFTGYMECSFVVGTPLTGGVFTPCEVPFVGPVGNENSHTQFPFEGNLSWIHTSMVWEYTNPLGAELYYNIYHPPYEIVGFSRGASPLINDIDSGNVTGFNDEQVIAFEAAASRSTTEGFAGAALSQTFDVYIVAFYNFLPPTDYQFWRDGPPTPPI